MSRRHHGAVRDFADQPPFEASCHPGAMRTDALQLLVGRCRARPRAVAISSGTSAAPLSSRARLRSCSGGEAEQNGPAARATVSMMSAFARASASRVGALLDLRRAARVRIRHAATQDEHVACATFASTASSLCARDHVDASDAAGVRATSVRRPASPWHRHPPLLPARSPLA